MATGEIRYTPAAYGYTTAQLAPIPQDVLERKISNGQALLDSASNFVLGTRLYNNHPYLTAVAAFVMHSNLDPQTQPGEEGFRIAWWSEDSQHTANLRRSSGLAAATFMRSHVGDPYDPANISVEVEEMRVRQVTRPEELEVQLAAFNELHVPRGYRERTIGEFVGPKATREYFIGTPRIVRIPIALTVVSTGKERLGKIYVSPSIFTGQQLSNQ